MKRKYELSERQRREITKAVATSITRIIEDKESVAPEIVLLVIILIFCCLYCCLKGVYSTEDQSISIAYLQLPFYTLFIAIVVLPTEYVRFINYLRNVVSKAMRTISNRITR